MYLIQRITSDPTEDQIAKRVIKRTTYARNIFHRHLFNSSNALSSFLAAHETDGRALAAVDASGTQGCVCPKEDIVRADKVKNRHSI